MQAVKKIFSHDDDDKSSSVGNTGSLAHNSGTGTNSAGVTSGQTTTGSGAGVDHIGSTHQHATAKAVDGGGLSHEHNLSKHQTPPAEGASHDHRHVAAVTKEKVHHHTEEEVQREREIDRHVHHVQHHVQPVLDTQHGERQHSEKVHAPTKIHEQHVNTDSDRQIFAGLNQHKDTVSHGHDTKKVIDKGEIVNENVSHHVHHVVQPVIERDTHQHSVIHTKIPIHQTTHEAPIIHQSSTHEPMHIKDFVKNGGDLKSTLTHDKAGVLADGGCERDVQGPGEKLMEKLHLGGGSQRGTTGATSAGTAGGVGHGVSGATGGVGHGVSPTNGATGGVGHGANTTTGGTSGISA